MPSTQFFEKLPASDSFVELFDEGRYVDVPEDWLLLITDVEGSTLAVKEGKYRSVNLVGAACIIAVLNVANGISVPYVFGGDGALIAIPPEMLDRARAALLGVARLSEEQYSLKLRVGAVPVSTLYEQKLRVSVAKFRLAGEDVLAMFWGDGLGKAESMVKAPGSSYLFAAGEGVADLSGLSCRWEPFRPEQGKILALLVKGRDEREAEVYRTVFEEVMRLIGGEKPAANPVKIEKMKKSRLLPSGYDLEQRLSSKLPFLSRLLTRLTNLFHILVGDMMFRFNLKNKTFDAPNYVASTVQRSDFRKFDGMLRMVVEVPNESREAVEALLARHYATKDLFYGLHWSDDAIMTCALFSMTENRHLHFIDGGDGGYAFAAIGLKKQMAEAAGKR